MYALEGFANYGEFGENFFRKITRAVVRIPKTIVQRAGQVVKGEVTAIAHGNILQALAISNPIYLGSKLTSDNKHLQNLAAMTMPMSVAAITDHSLRKKAAIGYAAAALVAGAVYAATAASATAATGTTAGGGGAVATGAGAAGGGGGLLTTIGTATGILGSGIGIAKQTGLIGRTKTPEATPVAYTTDETQKPLLESILGNPLALPIAIVGASIIGLIAIKSQAGTVRKLRK